MFTDLIQDLDIDGKEITFNFENSDLQVEKAQMTSKYKLLRENQSNELEKEAERHFGKRLISHINSPVQDTFCHQKEVNHKQASALMEFSERV